ncbi:ankyrin repeat domain-containing protein 22-like isoform X1 [Sinocyclocheilus grahami]|uniref:ankyrin repeat domain-containing protein 22-like isoform X1 n=1 Tax=Sinocyclocheilus grahami TaxID=75366 RepID=UPI0007ACFC69|nr:PREDICTED: ankyrin repeat domain-containing protein 22-like isoform X1 [Sinocyclocheilus grahami]
MCQAAYDDDIHKLQKLISADTRNVNVQDEGTGDTPIIAACRQGNLRTVKYLLDCNANVSIRNKKERTCLHYATRRTFSFLDYLMIAILMPILLIGYLIMEEKQRKSVKLMELLLATKVEVNAVDYKGNTGLHYACQRKSQRIVPLLLEKDADVSVQNKVESSNPARYCKETTISQNCYNFNKINVSIRGHECVVLYNSPSEF